MTEQEAPALKTPEERNDDPFLLSIAISLYNAWNYGTGSAAIWHSRKWETETDSQKDYWMGKALRELSR